MNFILLFFTVSVVKLILIHATIPTLKVEPQDVTVLEGEPLTVMCSLNQPILYCGWYGVDRKEVIFADMHPGPSLPKGVKYHGRGLEKGECGITITSAMQKHRLFTCQLFSYDYGVTGNATIVVVKAPILPRIIVTELNPGNEIYPLDTYKENQTIQAECTIKFPGKIFWFIGNESIDDGLSTPVIVDASLAGKTVSQTHTRKLKYSDDGKLLRCGALSIASGQETLHFDNAKLYVHSKPIIGDISGEFTIGQPGRIVITIHANPEPITEWLVDENKIPERLTDASYRYYAAKFWDRKQSKWLAVLFINEVRIEDVVKKYTLKATNSFGEAEYNGKCCSTRTARTPRLISRFFKLTKSNWLLRDQLKKVP